VRQSGSLNQTEFIIAMHYIAKLMDGTLTSLPDKLPPTVFQSAQGGNTAQQSPLMRNMTIGSPSFHNARQQSIMTPPQRTRTIDSLGNLAFGPSAPIHDPVQQWDVSAQEKQQFDVYFDKIDSSKAGVIQGKEAVEFFKNSRLPETELAHIWDLADIQQRGALSRDEFAVAMHLIHKKLAGGALPHVLPKSLIPPSATLPPQQSPFAGSPAFGSLSAFAPKSPAVFSASPAPQQNRSLIDDANTNDLLGDFGNDQVSHETNQVNLMQNQISSLSLQTKDIQNQKVSAEQVLEQLANQKKELEAQLANVRMTHEAAVKDLNELQETVRREEGEWDQVRTAYDAAQQQLTALQNEIAQTNQTLENGRAETESLRRRVHEIQEETSLANAELENLRAQTKQQSMMLDINRRQVTAAEQDRAQAKRHLEDYKVAGGLNTNDDEDSDSDSEDNEASIFADSRENPSTSESPEVIPSVVSTPALNNLFGDSPVPKSSSPFASSDFGASNSPFAAFSPSATSAPAPASTTDVDFDAIFGNISSTPSTTSTPINAFDPVQWATAPATPSGKTGRGPPPPPPQSRHHRQPSESVSSVNSATSPSTISNSKKPRAPPPPPPASASATTTAFSPTTQVPEEDEEDDFEAAFAGKQLPEAKIVSKDDDFADFDDAFSAFDIKASAPVSSPVPAVASVSPTVSKNDNWASSFGGFNFPSTEDTATTADTTAATTAATTATDTAAAADPAKPTTAASDDWDSIFGTSTTASNPNNTSSENAQVDQGFDDAFSSFGDDFGKQPVVASSKASEKKPANSTPTVPNSSSIGIVGDKIEELVKIGFAEQEAKDALNRYDQDLEKATNFLLDQSSKQQA
jgi:epidermal growth factor receptor substrate 15